MCNTHNPDTFREWMLKQFEGEEDTIHDIARYGCSAGFSGLIYTRDTVALYDEYTSEIWDWLREAADEYGYSCALAYAADFNGADSVTDADSLANLLLWAYAEHTASVLSDECPWENTDDDDDDDDEEDDDTE